MTTSRFRSPTDQPTTADIIIIGGGPAGTAALWALDRAAPDMHIVLLEKSDRLGAGSSLASLENFRTCWPALPLARQTARSIEVFRHADEYLGEGAAHSIALKERGYLFCAFNDAQAATLRADVTRLHEIGLAHIEFLNVDEVRYRFGWVGEKVIAAKYDPTAGWLDSNALIYKFVQNAQNAQIVLGVNDLHITTQGGHVTGVKTSAGIISAPKVVIAAGASSRLIGRTAGIELPIVIRPRHHHRLATSRQAFPNTRP